MNQNMLHLHSCRITGSQTLRHKLWSNTIFFFLLVPVWDTWWRNRLHIHTVWWWNLISSQWICEFSELQVLVCRKSHVNPWRRLVCACCECTRIIGPIVFPETITSHLYITHIPTPFLEDLSNYKAIFRAFWWHSNKQEIVALFTRFEPVQFSLAGMLKGVNCTVTVLTWKMVWKKEFRL